MRTLLLAATLAFASAPATAQTSAFPDDTALLAMIKSRVEDGRAAGIVLGVLDKDGSTGIVSYGDPGPGAKPLGPDSVFEIGSVTKTFTATLLADMAAKGEVKLDAPVQTYAPAGLAMPKRNGKEITLANLSEQNSGLPRLPGNMPVTDMVNPYAAYTTAQLYDFVSTYQLPRDPGEKYEYSNLGVGLLGDILSKRAGKSYEALVTERILAPLGMTSSGITLSPGMQANLAKGHDRAGKIVGNWDLPSLAGAGALRSSMTDMLKFLDANVGAPNNDLERAMRTAQQPRAAAGPSMKIGLNWHIMTRSSGAIVFHDGGTGGYGAFVAFDPAREVGVVLLNNTTLPQSDIALHLLDPSIPLTPKPAPPKARIAIDVPAEQLARFIGVYEFAAMPGFTMTFTVENGALITQATNQGKDRLYAEAPTEFFSKQVDAQITFNTDATGAVTSLTLHQGGANLPAKKIR